MRKTLPFLVDFQKKSVFDRNLSPDLEKLFEAFEKNGTTKEIIEAYFLVQCIAAFYHFSFNDFCLTAMHGYGYLIFHKNYHLQLSNVSDRNFTHFWPVDPDLWEYFCLILLSKYLVWHSLKTKRTKIWKSTKSHKCFYQIFASL